MTFSLVTAANWPIVGQLCWLLGKVMNFIYTMLTDTFNLQNGVVGLSIIIYTIIVYTCMLPMTINQQRTSKMSTVMNPEIQAIQKKYKNRKDQASMMKQQEEIQQVYDKYGTSMMGGCLPLLIQMPFLFALYPVIYSIETYVPAIKSAPESVQRFLTIPNLKEAPIQMIRNSGDYAIPAAAIIITAILLPVLSGATQMLNIKLSQSATGQQLDKDNPMAGTMKTMNTTMPLLSVFMVFTLPTGIGLYWIISAVVRTLQQIVINKHLSKMSVEDLIEKNKEKAKEKAKKRGERAERINEMAQANTKSMKKTASKKVSAEIEKEKELKVEKARQNAKNAKPGSLANKANMVERFNKNN
ncbi:MAG: YidC/Oxa1 family membrane protein insertase [Dorea sp.]|nr:YidC/Oxa1 family membrane protein insertase [Dorea sp.]